MERQRHERDGFADAAADDSDRKRKQNTAAIHSIHPIHSTNILRKRGCFQSDESEDTENSSCLANRSSILQSHVMRNQPSKIMPKQLQQQYQPLHQPARPCPHITLQEHNSCMNRQCEWSVEPVKDMSYLTHVPILRKPFSRTGNLALRRWVNRGSGTVALRDHLETLCVETRLERGYKSDDTLGDGDDCGRNPCVEKCPHDCGNDLRKDMIPAYVAHWARIWAAWEDRVPGDGYQGTHDVEVREEVYDLHANFPKLAHNYRILDKIGEGTFSSVYKAVDINHSQHINEWCACFPSKSGSGVLEGNRWAVCGLVALKRIYVTSSTDRILNELAMIKKLSNKPNIAGLITAIRSKDQIIAALPYYQFDDFRDFIDSNPSVVDIADYMRALMIGLRGVHEESILHRDVKPTNFLYNRQYKTGVVVDFGLAQQVTQKPKPLVKNIQELQSAPHRPPGYYEVDKRTSIRGANRAGTRGFRAPEVLLRVVQQSTAIDVWAAGVILLCILTKTYPFFQSSDDLDALLEITTLFGTHEMKKIALLNNRRLHMVLQYDKTGVPFETVVEKLNPGFFSVVDGSADDKKRVFDFLRGLLTLRSDVRMTTEQSLAHPFLLRSE
ncbi:hypothetical protein HDU81_000757 [Chytriomyces hyalinus]|nr:hypothetical protein HDU81_000757 [Chytriomyces hyalinus]